MFPQIPVVGWQPTSNPAWSMRSPTEENWLAVVKLIAPHSVFTVGEDIHISPFWNTPVTFLSRL